MKLLRYFLPAVTAFTVATSGLSALAITERGEILGSSINERDMEAIKQHVSVKRATYLEEKVNNLGISGDVRAEYKYISEKIGGVQLRGNRDIDDCLLWGKHEFDVEFNLYLDYTTDRTWAAVHLEFDNDAGVSAFCPAYNRDDFMTNSDDDFDGVFGDDLNDLPNCGSGLSDRLSLRQAYMGYNILEEGDYRLDIEVGRQDMYSIFDSRVQFQSRFDGVLMKYSNSFEDVGDFYLQAGVFVIDSVINNFGWAFESALMNIADVGVDFKYSLIDWTTSETRCDSNVTSTDLGDFTNATNCARAMNFRVQQFTVAYHFDPEWLDMDVKVYGALLWNSAAKASTSHSLSGNKENIAWYLGMLFSGMKEEGDWSVDVMYQHVQAQAIPDHDLSGIGRGNVFGHCYANQSSDSNFQLGNGNYYGFLVEGGYALTDNITLTAEYEYSHEDSVPAAGGNTSRYHKFETEAMYAF
jgi:opacity protein-like surface antigen